MSSSPKSLPITPKTRIKRIAKRGDFDRAVIYDILDEALIAHVGFQGEGGQVMVMPTACWRVEDYLYIHGARASRMLRCSEAGQDLCITVTLLDALVLARSAFHHSMNYRSVVLFGKAEAVEGQEKIVALTAFVEDVVPGRSKSTRPPNETELKKTTVLKIPIQEASAKIRTGPVSDDETDYSLPVWAGLVPFGHRSGPSENDSRLVEGVTVPDGLKKYKRGKN